MATAIEFNNISKIYRLGLVSTGTLSNDLKRWWTMNILHKEDPFLTIGETNDRSTKGTSDYVWALKDIDFKVEQGDVVGIIGKNGAGKSTLLKILSKITAPTTGSIRARGRIASLLEVGTGFHPEMTGRENIYLNGAILGMTKHEIDRKIDEIIDFSGCERYIDTPTKRYSSGMTVRLGFAVAAHLDPEILVVDEVLAVGDAEFQKKAIGKMKDVSHGEGRTVLFVSHNMSAVRNLCKKGIILKNGRVENTGTAEAMVSEYLNERSNLGDFDLATWEDRLGSGLVRFQSVYVTDEFGSVTNTILTGTNPTFNFIVMAKEPAVIDIGFSFFNADDVMISNLYASYQKQQFRVHTGINHITCTVKHFPFCASSLTIRGNIKIDKKLSDAPSCYLNRVSVEYGNFYNTNLLVDHDAGIQFQFAGDWAVVE